MGVPTSFNREKLVIGVLISRMNRKQRKQELLRALEAEFGAYDYVSEEIDFTFTDYYTQEMGASIRRFFLSFQNLTDPEDFWRIKLRTNRIEANFSDRSKRKVNLDPGLLAMSRFVLASTKDGSHRIPLREGIYAEITLTFEKGFFRPLPWTYPDYRSDTYRKILTKIRALYKEQYHDLFS